MRNTTVVLLSAVALTGCFGDNKKPTYEFMPHMMDTPAVKAQRPGPFGEGMRVPPQGTISQEAEPYRFAKDPEGAGRSLKNPLPRTMVNLEMGKKLYNTYCIVCHGDKGEGNGSIVPKFPQPPSLHSDKVRDWTDGRLFHVITMGQNLMPSYASQAEPKERWAIIHYVRVLQRALNPSQSDLSAHEKAKTGK
ncbi:MAG: cytochrome c [Bdellovibrionota bacterium]